MDIETPRRFGGAELNIDAVLEVTAAIAEGCSSTGWAYALWTAHGWLMAQWPESVQEQVFSDPKPLVSTIVKTSGAVKAVDGGYLLTAKGPFSSGVDHCTWLLARIDKIQLHPAQPPELNWFLLPKSDLVIEDDWHTVGLRGTGSKTVSIDNVFVPEERVMRGKIMDEGKIGAELYKSPLFCSAMDFVVSIPMAGPVLGIAHGMVNAFEDFCRKRAGQEQTPALLRLAKAAAEVDAAHATLLKDARLYCNIPADSITEADRATCRRDVSYSGQLCRAAINSLFEASGSNSVYNNSDFSRRWRDGNVAAAHGGLRWDVHGTNYGRVAAGMHRVSGAGLII